MILIDDAALNLLKCNIILSPGRQLRIRFSDGMFSVFLRNAADGDVSDLAVTLDLLFGTNWFRWPALAEFDCRVSGPGLRSPQ